ncbi:MFS transporter [Novosphingobium flavum]|uniref:MFS transporter n=1 Tax=Novosphingobium flavum TaxID=1778672 RepID=A0A7X1FS73_9SPHN|nr:MFS transporter [Novosphingobium flavum]MBC2666018.1 MFS transporter [Novosphingobium flavum]
MPTTDRAPWGLILLIYLIGVAAMLVVSIAVPALGGIGAEFHPKSQSLVGWVMSMPALAAALGSLPMGGLVDRFGDRRIMVAGAALVLLGDVGVITAGSIETLLAWRVVGGFGYVGMAVAAVTMISRLTAGKQRVAALALWSTVIPASFIASSIYGATAGAHIGWRGAFIGHAAATAVLVAVGRLLLPGIAPDARQPNRMAAVKQVVRTPWPFVLGLSFAAAAFLQTGFVATLPHLLSVKLGAEEAEVHSFNILAMLCNVGGAFLFGALCNRGVRPAILGCAALTMSGLCAAGLILAPSDMIAAIGMNCGLMFGLGVLVGMWALMPIVAPSPAAMGATSGLITQVTLVGVLFGPPLAFAGLHAGENGSLLFLAAGLVIALVGWPVWRRGGEAPAAPAAH